MKIRDKFVKGRNVASAIHGTSKFIQSNVHIQYTKHSTLGNYKEQTADKKILIDRLAWMIVKLTYLQYNIQFKFDEYLSTSRIYTHVFFFIIVCECYKNKSICCCYCCAFKYNIIVMHMQI